MYLIIYLSHVYSYVHGTHHWLLFTLCLNKVHLLYFRFLRVMIWYIDERKSILELQYSLFAKYVYMMRAMRRWGGDCAW